MTKKYRLLVGALIMSLLTLIGGLLVVQAAGDCDGTTGNDVINCMTNPVTPDDQIDGELGNDNITQGAGVTTSFIDADGQDGSTGDNAGSGNGGNDTIVNNGTVTVSISGDYVSGIPGDDSITNNGITGDILGDETQDNTVKNGNDTIVNNGTVTGSIRGDGNSAITLEGGRGGDDAIVNNGTIGKDIVADSGASGIGGNDSITNNGTVNGNIDAGDGNDIVTIGDGATVGGIIDGYTGTDTLQFKFNDPAAGAAAATLLAGLSPTGGTATFGGHTYTWTNFEQLQALFTAAAGGGGGTGGGGSTGGGQPITVTVRVNGGQIKDGRVNGYDLGAPFAVYCVPNESVQVIDISKDGNNALAISVKFDLINTEIAKAKASAQSVSIGSGLGDFLAAEADGSLVASGPTLDGSKTYTFRFQSDCTYIANGIES